MFMKSVCKLECPVEKPYIHCSVKLRMAMALYREHVFFSKPFFNMFLLKRHIHREKEKQKDLHLLAHSLNNHNGQS